MISIDIVEKPDSQWNDRLKNSPDGTIYQTKEYSNYIRTILGWETSFLRFVNPKGKIVAQLMLSINKRSEKKGKIGKIFQKLPIKDKIQYRWISGPLTAGRPAEQLRESPPSAAAPAGAETIPHPSQCQSSVTTHGRPTWSPQPG